MNIQVFGMLREITLTIINCINAKGELLHVDNTYNKTYLLPFCVFTFMYSLIMALSGRNMLRDSNNNLSYNKICYCV